MPRYFFNVHDGEDMPDREGTELPDDSAARVQAIETAGELIKGEASSFWSGAEWTMEVSDAAGAILFKLKFTLTAK